MRSNSENGLQDTSTLLNENTPGYDLNKTQYCRYTVAAFPLWPQGPFHCLGLARSKSCTLPPTAWWHGVHEIPGLLACFVEQPLKSNQGITRLRHLSLSKEKSRFLLAESLLNRSALHLALCTVPSYRSR